MKNTKTNQIATHIGHNVSAIGKPITPTMRSASLVLLESSAVEEDCGFVPAASIVVHGEDSVRQLRDFCDEVLGGKDRPAPPVELPSDFAELRELIFVLLSYYESRRVPFLQEHLLKRLNLVPEATFSKLKEFIKLP